jgi:hypothetical protein
MRHCSNPECPHRLAVGVAAEFVDDARPVCSDCGALLLEGPAPRPEDALPPVGAALHTRAWITVGVPLAVLLVALLVPVPGLHIDVPSLRGFMPVRTPSVVELGIMPFFGAAVACDLARRVWPSWRPRTAAERARAPLGIVAAALGGLAAAAMGWQGGTLLAQADMSTLPAWRVAATLVAGSALLLAAATLVTRRGLAPGLALLPACIVLAVSLDTLGQAWRGDLTLRDGTLPLVAMAATAAVTWWATATHRRLRGQVDGATLVDAAAAPQAQHPPDPSEPARAEEDIGAASGVVIAAERPASAVPVRGQDIVVASRMPVVRLPLAAFPVLLLPLGFEQLRYAAYQLQLTRVFESGFGPPAMRWATLGVLAVVLLLADRAVLRPASAAVTWARAAGDDRIDVYERWLRAVGKGASVRGLGWAAALITLSLTCQVGLWTLLLSAMATAAVLDARAEWRARRVEPALTTIAHDDDPATADAALFALRRAGIEGHVRALRTRALLRFVGPFVPMEVMVPRARADEARALVAAVQGEPQGSRNGRTQASLRARSSSWSDTSRAKAEASRGRSRS